MSDNTLRCITPLLCYALVQPEVQGKYHQTWWRLYPLLLFYGPMEWSLQGNKKNEWCIFMRVNIHIDKERYIKIWDTMSVRINIHNGIKCLDISSGFIWKAFVIKCDTGYHCTFICNRNRNLLDNTTNRNAYVICAKLLKVIACCFQQKTVSENVIRIFAGEYIRKWLISFDARRTLGMSNLIIFYKLQNILLLLLIELDILTTIFHTHGYDYCI